MSSKDTPLPVRLSSSYKQLTESAATLNAVSDELGKSITALDSALQRLNLGITTWVRVGGWDDPEGEFLHRDLGYAKIGGKWGIGLRTLHGHSELPEHTSEEVGLFNDAPRAARIEAVEKLPDLLDQLVEDANSAAKMIRQKTLVAKEFVAALGTGASATRR